MIYIVCEIYLPELDFRNIEIFLQWNIFSSDADYSQWNQQGLALVQSLVSMYFNTARVKLTVAKQSLKNLLKDMAKRKLLQLHPANSIRRILETKAILCLDELNAPLIRHKQLYLLWQIADLLNIDQEQLLITVTCDPCHLYCL